MLCKLPECWCNQSTSRDPPPALRHGIHIFSPGQYTTIYNNSYLLNSIHMYIYQYIYSTL